MVYLKRRALLGACATVLGGTGLRKPARAQAAGHVDMRPFSDIARTGAPRTLPAVSFKTLDGGVKSLADFAGRPLVLNFWATWCVPCVAELPELDHLSATDTAVRVVAVSADRTGAAAVRPFLAAHGLEHLTILLDPGSDAVHALGVFGFPTTLLIDSAGRLRGTLEGPAAWASGEAAIAAVVAGSS